MRLPPSVTYGLRALCHLARFGSAVTRDIAEMNGIPSRYLEAIIAKLREAELVRGKRGPRGGFRLARPATEIRVTEVMSLLKHSSPYEGAGVECIVHDRLQGVLEGMTIASLTHENATRRRAG